MSAPSITGSFSISPHHLVLAQCTAPITVLTQTCQRPGNSLASNKHAQPSKTTATKTHQHKKTSNLFLKPSSYYLSFKEWPLKKLCQHEGGMSGRTTHRPENWAQNCTPSGVALLLLKQSRRTETFFLSAHCLRPFPKQLQCFLHI